MMTTEQRDLLVLMKRLSGDHLSAGWTHPSTSMVLWEMLTGEPRWRKNPPTTYPAWEAQCSLLRSRHEAAGGWFIWDEEGSLFDPYKFIPTSAWLETYEAICQEHNV